MQLSSGVRALWCTGVLGAIVTAGCGGGGDGFKSGIAGNKKLSELTASELQTHCDAATNYRAATLSPELQARASCAQQGLQSRDPEACEEISMSCLEELEEAADAGTAPTTMQRFMCYTASEFNGCEASVAELDSCIGSSFAIAARALYALRCDTLTHPNQVVSTTPMQSTVCQALNAKCSGVGNVTGRVTTVTVNPGDGGTDGGTDSGIDSGVDAGDAGQVACTDLALQYDSSNCASTSCSPVTCPCQPLSRSFTACNSVQGCLSAIDCDAACAASSVSFVLSCAQSTACTSDANCGDYHCAFPYYSTTSGACTRGEGGNSCDDNGDCQSGTCQNIGSSNATCTGHVAEGGTCTQDVQCQSGICYQSSFSVPGTCSQGEAGDPCTSSSDCASSICVYDSGSSTYSCSDGSAGTTCQSDSQCTSGICAYGGRSTSTCVEGAAGDPCDYDSDCDTYDCRTATSGSTTICAYTPGETCPDGIADCNGDCRPAQAGCSGGSCTPDCGGDCGLVTLAVWNSADKQASISLSNSDRTATTTGLVDGVRATLGKSTGKWYWEVTLDVDSSSDASIGVTNVSASLEDGLGNSSVDGAGLSAGGALTRSPSYSETICSYSDSDVVGIALDVTNAVVYFSINGVWQGGADPDANQNGTPIGISAEAVYPIVSLSTSDMVTANFGQSDFAHTPPSGFSPLY